MRSPETQPRPSDGLSTADLGRLLEGACAALGSSSALHLGLGENETIGGIRLLRRIAVGGMGVVYEAEQASPQRRVAIKLIPPGLLTDANLRRFQLEADVLGRLNHPAIAKLHYAGIHSLQGEDGFPYFVMELVDGARPITTYSFQNGLSYNKRISLFIECCRAIAEAHRHGVIHRDIKPGNLLVSGAGAAKVIDFGIARLENSDLGLTPPTEESSWIGTIEYAAPERLQGAGSPSDTRTDVYSLGVVLHELLFGTRPAATGRSGRADAGDSVSTFSGRCKMIRELRAPRDLATVLARSLASDPERRYASASELADDLDRWGRGLPVLAGEPGAALRFLHAISTHRHLTIVAALLVLLGLSTYLTLSLGLDVRSARENSAWLSYRSQISRAGAALSLGSDRPGAATAALRDTPAELRGWEHSLLRSIPVGDQCSVSWPSVPTALCFANRSPTVLVGDETGRVSLCSVSHLAEPLLLARLDNPITKIEVAGDDSTVVASDARGHSVVIFQRTPALSYSISANGISLTSLDSSLVVATEQRWSVVGLHSRQTLVQNQPDDDCEPLIARGNPFELGLVSINPHAKTGAKRYSLGHSWDLVGGFGRVLDARWLYSADDMLILTAANGPIFWRKGVTSAPRPSLPIGGAECFDIESGGSLGVFGTAKGLVILGNMRTQECQSSFVAHDGPVTSVALSTNSGLIASGGSDRLVRIWPLKLGREALFSPTLPATPHGVRVSCYESASGSWIGVSDHGQISQVYVRSSTEVRTASAPGFRPTFVAASSDANEVVVGFDNDATWIVRMADGDCRSITTGTGGDLSGSYLSTGEIVLLAKSGELRCIDATSGAICWATALPAPGGAISRHHPRLLSMQDDRLFVVLASTSTIGVVVNADSGRVERQLCGAGELDPADVVAVASSGPDAWVVATASGRMFRFATNQKGETLIGSCAAPPLVLLVSPVNTSGLAAISRTGLITFVSPENLTQVGSVAVTLEAITGAFVDRLDDSLIVSTARGRLLRLSAGDPPVAAFDWGDSPPSPAPRHQHSP
ncbi:MAG: protein kinase [Phycisphaerales bacterium]